MNKLRRFDVYTDAFEKEMYQQNSPHGCYCDADEALDIIDELEGKTEVIIDELEQTIEDYKADLETCLTFIRNQIVTIKELREKLKGEL